MRVVEGDRRRGFRHGSGKRYSAGGYGAPDVEGVAAVGSGIVGTVERVGEVVAGCHGVGQCIGQQQIIVTVDVGRVIAAHVTAGVQILGDVVEGKPGIFLQTGEPVVDPIALLGAEEDLYHTGQQKQADGHGHHKFDQRETGLAVRVPVNLGCVLFVCPVHNHFKRISRG